MRILLAIVATFLTMNAATFVSYGTASAAFGLQPPDDGSPLLFLGSVVVVKIGLAAGFVVLFSLASDSWIGRWPRYAAVWWVMSAVIEVGQAIAPNYSALDAGAGIVAEAMYFPLSAFFTARLLAGDKRNEPRAAQRVGSADRSASPRGG